jgi:hypothetical protein
VFNESISKTEGVVREGNLLEEKEQQIQSLIWREERLVVDLFQHRIWTAK